MRKLSLLPLCGLLATLAACDVPPDVHVHITSDYGPPVDYAVWRLWGQRRLNPRCTRTARYATAGFSGPRELPSECIVRPRGPLPDNEWQVLRVDAYEPEYRSNSPQASVQLAVRFREGHHLRLDVHLLRTVAGRAGYAFDRCPPVWAASGCRPPTEAERQVLVVTARARRALVRPPASSDFDENDAVGYDPFADADISPCLLVCPNLPEESSPAPSHPSPPTPPAPASPPRDAGFDAARDAPRDAGLDALDAGPLPDVAVDAQEDVLDDDPDADVLVPR